MKMKKLIPVIIIALILAATLLSCGEEKKEEEKSSAREYYSVDLSAFSLDDVYLKRIHLDDDGRISEIYNFGRKRREAFHYVDGRLEYSETFELYDPTESYVSRMVGEVKLYETRYVYEGDVIVRGEVFFNGSPTKSYDEYEYRVDGKLKSVKRYEHGRLNETYIYNGKDYPESYQFGNNAVYLLEYDENGNAISAKRQNLTEDQLSIEYIGGKPSRAIKRWAEDGDIKESDTVYTYYINGALWEIERDTVGTSSVEYRFDESGRLLNKTTDFGKQKAYENITYDGDGNLIKVEFLDNNEKIKLSVSISYLNGKASKKEYFSKDDQSPIETFEFDGDGRLTKKIGFLEGDPNSEITYEYYPSGVKKAQKVKGGAVTTYAENGLKLLTKYSEDEYIEFLRSEICYGFDRSADTLYLDMDAAGALKTKEVNKSGVFEYEYDENYVVRKETNKKSDGKAVVIEYNERGKRIKLTEYDAAGNITKEESYN